MRDKKPMPQSAKLIIALVSIAVWLGIWHFFSERVGQELLLPSPRAVFGRLFELIHQNDFWIQTFGSLGRILTGFGIALAVGCVLSVLMFLSDIFDQFMRPFLTVVKATPIPSFIILALVWMKSDKMPVFITFLMVLPVICSNLTEGLRGVDRRLVQMARVYNIKGIRMLGVVYFPSVLPYMLAAVKTGLGLAWKAGVAAEVIGRTRGSIGQMLYESKLYLETVDLFAYTVTVVVLSCLIELLVVGLTKLTTRRSSDADRN